MKDSYVGNLTPHLRRILRVQAQIFARGTLPATGMNVEFTQLKSNTLKVEQQLEEGDTLAYESSSSRTAPLR